MSCIIDHLRVDHQIRVLRDFTDMNGQPHRTNEAGVLRALDLDWVKQAMVLEWDHDGRRETICFSLTAKTGPRNGAMREFFETDEARPLSRKPSAQDAPPAKRAAQPHVWPAPSAALITNAEQWEPAVQRIAGLAACSSFLEVETQIQALLVDVGPTGWRLKQLADDLGELAAAHADSDDRSIYEWLRDRSIRLLHAWGSCATSGGEGAVCGDAIDARKQRFAKLDQS